MRAAPSGFDRDLEHAVALVLRRSVNRSRRLSGRVR
jgi:hypothetical protein